MVLLIGHQYVRDKRALTRKKRYRDFDGLAVPVLAAFKSPYRGLTSRGASRSALQASPVAGARI